MKEKRIEQREISSNLDSVISGNFTGRKHSAKSIEKSRLSHLGKKLSPESIQKRTETRRRLYLEGKLVSPMKGKHQSEEAKRKIGLASINRKVSNETRTKISDSRIGSHPTIETLKKQSDSHKGILLSEEHKAKIRENTPRGENSYLWKGGISPLSEWIRKSLLYKQWLNKCMERDNWMCIVCHKRGGYLQVHHINLFSIIMKKYNIKTKDQARLCNELWDINNGVTMCEECHNFTHKYIKQLEKDNDEQPNFSIIVTKIQSNLMKGGTQ